MYKCISIEEITSLAKEGFASELNLIYEDLDILVSFERYICIKNCKVFDGKKDRKVIINGIEFKLDNFKGNFLVNVIEKYREIK